MAVVIRARINPALYSPMWALHHRIVGEAEYEQTDLNVISSELTQFQLAWLSLTATTDSLQLTTTDVTEFERLRDAASSIIALLDDVPFVAMGITRSVHFGVNNFEDWHRVGDTIGPKDIWRGLLELPGTQNVTTWGIRPDLYEGRIAVQVEPSARLRAGVFVSINEHFELTEVTAQPKTRSDFIAAVHERTTNPTPEDDDRASFATGRRKRQVAEKILREEWLTCFRRSSAIIDRVKSLPTQSIRGEGRR